jgi:hypothetical protein
VIHLDALMRRLIHLRGPFPIVIGGTGWIAVVILFILVYQKTHPLQTMHGLHFGLSQPQAHYWIHHLLPVLQRALADLGLAPEREASRVAGSPLVLEGASELAIDGSERCRQRPQDAVAQKEHYSGKKKAHTDKNILLVNGHTRKVAYLRPTVAGGLSYRSPMLLAFYTSGLHTC